MLGALSLFSLLLSVQARGKQQSLIGIYDGVFTLFGLNIGEHVENRIVNHLESISGLIVAVFLLYVMYTGTGIILCSIFGDLRIAPVHFKSEPAG